MDHLHHGTISRWQGAGLMATTLLGTGVFILPQLTIAVAGNGALIAWFLIALAMIPIALVFGRLAGTFPHAAGPAYFVEKAFGQTAGRTVGLLFLLVIPMGVPAALLMTFQFIDALIPLSGWSQVIGELVVLLGIFLLNSRGIQISAKLQLSLTLCIVFIVLLLFGIAGLNPQPFDVLSHHAPFKITTIMTAAGIAFWSFLGIEAMTHLANDFRSPKQDMIPAMIIGTIAVCIIYLSCTLLLLLIPSTDLPINKLNHMSSNVAMINLFDHLFNHYFSHQWGTVVIGGLGIASGFATVNVYTASAARLVWSFSCDGVLPRFLSTRNRYHVPTRALATLLLMMVFVIIFTFITKQELHHLIAWSNGVFAIIYLMVMLAAIKLLSRRYWFSIILGCLFCLTLMIALGTSMIYAFIISIFIIPFLHWQRKHLAKDPKLENANESKK